MYSAGQLLRERIAKGAGAWAWRELGTVELALGRTTSAIEALGRAVDLEPDNPAARIVRATAYFRLNDLASAEHDLYAALELDPANTAALYNLAVLRQSQSDPDQAHRLYDKVLAVDSTHFGARLNRAGLRLQLDDPQGALEDLEILATDKTLSANPLLEQVRINRGVALACVGRLDEAKASLAGTAAEGNPRLAPLAVRISRLLLRLAVCDWRERSTLEDLLRRCTQDDKAAPALDEPGLIFNALALPLTSLEQRALSELALRSARAEGARLERTLPALSVVRNERTRVGFFAAGLRVHPESFLLRRIFSDRDSKRFEYFLYALNPDDGSSLRAELARSADRFSDASTWRSDAIVHRARTDALDIAIDLSGTYSFARPELFAARLAAVQAAYMATPCSLGPGLHDYRISDPYATPPSEQSAWAEKLVLVAPMPWVYDNELQAAAVPPRDAVGLPPQGFVFACMNQAFKLEPESFDIWMRLLQAVPGSVLWMLDHGSVANANLRREATARGVEATRIVLAPRADLPHHLGRLSHADLFLDTFGCNAHTTALDALWAGVPVLTMAGRTMASRLAGTFLSTAGLSTLVATSVVDYESRALEIARVPAVRAGLAEQVRAAKGSALFDTSPRVRSFERAIEAMVKRHRAGLAPDTLLIDDGPGSA